MIFIKKSLLICLLAMAAGSACWIYQSGIAVVWPTFLEGLGFLGLWLALAFMIEKMKGDARIATGLYVLSGVVGFSILTFLWTYASIALHAPLVDVDLAHFDAALGFDWSKFYDWVHAHQLLSIPLSLAYLSFIPQILLLTLFLCYRGHNDRAWELLWLFAVGLFCCCVVSRIWQAAGAFAYFNTGVEGSYVQEFMALYNHTLTTIGSTREQGLIQFPSFHALMAVAFTYVTRGTRILFPAMVALNLIMLISVLPCGGHFLADMLAGVALALALIALLRSRGVTA